MNHLQNFKDLIDRDIFADHLAGEIYFSKETIYELLEMAQNENTKPEPSISEQITLLENEILRLSSSDGNEKRIELLKTQIDSLKEMTNTPHGC